MKGFIPWKLAFFKAVAAASITPDEAFIWICQVSSAKSIDDLAISGNFPALDALLSTEWDKILTGEFKKSVQVIEYDLLKQQKMMKGRQITWLVFDHFKLSDVDGAMLNWDEIIRLQLHMPGDNVKQFLNDWDTTFANINGTPDPVIPESLFKRQLEKSNQLKQTLALYDQEITQRQATKCYKRLRYIVDDYMSESLLKKNQQALAKRPKGFAAIDGKIPKQTARPGYCSKWSKSGDCAAGNKCPWAASHTPENKSWWSKIGQPDAQTGAAASAKAKGKGGGKKGGKNGKTRSPSPNKGGKPERGRSRERKKDRDKSSSGSRDKKTRPSTPTPKDRGTSPSGNKDKPACFRWLKGTCTDKNCGWWHSPP